jgi:hypothetical protein
VTGLSVAATIAAADAGPALTGEIFPLSGVGKVRVTYNWLYSGLNCDPGDQSGFSWVFQKMPGGAVALSPGAAYAEMTLFASVRPDNDNFVQVQAPFSADWITQAQGDEEMTMTDLGLLTVELQGVNGSYLGANASQTSYNDSSGNPHSGYRIQSNVGTPDLSSKFFVAVQQNLQAGAQAPLFSSLSPTEVVAELVRQGAGDPQTLAEGIFAATSR